MKIHSWNRDRDREQQYNFIHYPCLAYEHSGNIIFRTKEKSLARCFIYWHDATRRLEWLE